MEAYTIPEAAQATGLSPKEIRLRIEEGRLRVALRGGHRVIEHAELGRTGLLGEGRTEPPTALSPEGVAKLVDRVESQAGELAVLRRASAEQRTRDERERRRLEKELAEARRELAEARARTAELEAAGLRVSLRPGTERASLKPLFERRPEPPQSPRS